jgi:hypothetical protein
MPRIALSVFLFLAASIVSNVFAQAAPPGAGTPPGAGDKNLGDDSVKMRSVEMDRVKKELKGSAAASSAPINKQISAKFPEIKEDFEGIQISQAEIVKAYTTGKIIDYGLIDSLAKEVSRKAKRLDGNLFAPSTEKAGPGLDKKDKEKAATPGIRDIIIDLDNAVGRFVSSRLFANIQLIDPEVAVSTRTDLHSILHLSEMLSAEAARLK